MAKKNTDLLKMTEEEIEHLSAQLGEEINKKLNKPLEAIEKLLAKYNLEIQFGYEISRKQED